LDVDAIVRFDALTKQALPALETLAPYGLGNAEPLFCTTGVEAKGVRTMGATGAHLQMHLKDGRTLWRAVGFNLGERLAEFDGLVDVVYSLETDWWQGTRTVRLNLKDVRPAANANG
ncbi:MAG: single-stranded-DNA-specific exonuclease RecJ, partial [Chloroflexi bacterium]|nr:single-stranded-DNA-specific exonuclease RecJ [Chloroflexota bacterium]